MDTVTKEEVQKGTSIKIEDDDDEQAKGALSQIAKIDSRKYESANSR